MAYILDANCLIQAKNREYGLISVRLTGTVIMCEHVSGKVLSVESVGDEIAAGNDDFSTWAANLPSSFFVKPDALMLKSLGVLSLWAQQSDYDAAAVSEFFSAADYFLIGHAMAYGHVIVTHENAVPKNKRIKIPVACIPNSVKVITPYQMLRLERARFVLN